MDKDQTKRVKALLIIAEADLKACRTMVRTPAALHPERLKCHLKHWLENGAEILALLDESENDGGQITLGLEPVEMSNGTHQNGDNLQGQSAQTP